MWRAARSHAITCASVAHVTLPVAGLPARTNAQRHNVDKCLTHGLSPGVCCAFVTLTAIADTLDPPPDDGPAPLQRILALLVEKRIRRDGSLMSNREFAEEIGMSRTMIGMLLDGQWEPGKDTLALLMAWDVEFVEPATNYLRAYGQRLRRRSTVGLTGAGIDS